MQGLIRKLYASVFSFLRQALRWYEDKRRKILLNSFNENFYEAFSDTIEEIRQIGRLIHTKGMIANHAETRDVRVMVESIMNEKKENSADDEYWKLHLKKLWRNAICFSIWNTGVKLDVTWQTCSPLKVDS
jgi:hypothetical protein